MSSKFKQFCTDNYKTLQFFETLAIVLVFILLGFLVINNYFLQYKVVLVEQYADESYHVVKELIVNGKITDDITLINTAQEEQNYLGKIKIENTVFNSFEDKPFLYNIT